jgi:ribonuclease-3
VHEGELARWYNHLVRAETCAVIAQDWDLGRHIMMSGGKPTVGCKKKTISPMPARRCSAPSSPIATRRRAISCIALGAAPRQVEIAAPDAKSVLQEWAQGRKLALPRYLEIAREGPDHAPRFTSEVQIEGIEPERGQGANKRAAEQAAAYRMLLREGVWTEPDNV